jgi:chromosomal replication initiation ATPase DnaA
MKNTPDIPLDCRVRGVDKLLRALYAVHEDHELCPGKPEDARKHKVELAMRKPPANESPQVNFFLYAVLTQTGVSKREFFSFSRGLKKSFARRLFIYLLRNHLGMSWRKIAISLGGFDTHAIRDGYAKFLTELQADTEVSEKVDRILKKAEAA